MNIGIDFGGVIVTPSEGSEFDAQAGLSIEVVGAINAIAKLNVNHNVWIVSKASKRVQHFTREWLNTVHFYQATSFNPANLIFCEKRAQKAFIAQQIALDIFIDDNAEVIASMKNCVALPLHFIADTSWVDTLNAIQKFTNKTKSKF